MEFDLITLLGFTAGAITSVGFTPQLVKGYRTKKLDDVSYWMPIVLAIGMTLWLLYGVFRQDLAVIVANAFGITCSITLIVLKKRYAKLVVP
jgi:MtN3 and saliva related transmembrane protein